MRPQILLLTIAALASSTLYLGCSSEPSTRPAATDRGNEQLHPLPGTANTKIELKAPGDRQPRVVWLTILASPGEGDTIPPHDEPTTWGKIKVKYTDPDEGDDQNEKKD